MPELAEVETVCRQIDSKMRGHKIVDVMADQEDRYLFAFAKIKDIKKALVGAKVLGTGRKGKYFWLQLDRKPWPLFHLGMSGNIALLDPKKKKSKHEKIWGGVKLWSEDTQSTRERLWFSRLLLKCDRL